MSLPRSVALYARISSDQASTGLGVARQLEDCRSLAADLGWQIAEEYVDNDVSAFGTVRRPAYDRMLDDIDRGERDGVLAYHVDRLTRRPLELERFIQRAEAGKLQHVRFVSGGDLTPSNADSLFMLRVLAALAAQESGTRSRRVRRKHDQIATTGRPNGGARPFGYEADRMTIRPIEAEIIRTLVDRYLAGESLRSLTTWLQSQDIPTAKGGSWLSHSLAHVLKSPRIAGLREHRGQVVGPAAWDAIIPVSKHEKVVSRMIERSTSGKRSPRRYLLSGLLRCGKCGNPLFSAARATTRRYVCNSGPDHGGCGRLTIVAEPLEQFIADAVLYRLDTPELVAALTSQGQHDKHTADVAEAVGADRAQLDELAELYAAKQITAREWIAARKSIEDRIRSAERQLARATKTDALVGVIGDGTRLRKQWGELNLTRQHAIVAALIDHIVIAPGSPGPQQANAARADIRWRV